MKKIYVVITVFVCALMICCKKEPEAEGIVVPGIYNLSYLDSLDLCPNIKIIPIDSVLPGENGPLVAFWWNIPLHDAMIEFNKRFNHFVQQAVDEESKKVYTKEEIEWIQDENKFDYNKVRGAERDLDTIINHRRYIFMTEL